MSREAMQMALDALVSSTGELHLRLASPTDMQLVKNHKAIQALRTALAQPKKEWVGLTDEDINDHWTTAMRNTKGTRLPIPEFARAIEAKLKQLNNI